ncbi:MAG: DUF1588 domain-containing protein [Myxococcota bacterium]
MKRRTLGLYSTTALTLALTLPACRDDEGEQMDDGSGGIDTLGGGEDGGGGAAARCATDRMGPPMVRRLTRGELEATLRDVFPEIDGSWSGVSLGPDPVTHQGFSNDAEALAVGLQTAGDILDTAQDVATLVTAADTLATVLPCAATAPDRGCATEFVEQRGAALFRRPLDEEEIARYVEYYDSVAERSDFATGLRWTTVALIQSPLTVYRSELGSNEGGVYRLDPYEIASALAYDFSGLPPTDDLIARAVAGEFDDPEARIEVARELLATEAGHAVLERFFREWSGYGQVAGAVRDDPDFEGVRDAMDEETRRFIEAVVYEDEADVYGLLTANYSVVNADLASYYGYGAPGGDFARVERPAQWGIGLLAQGSVLAANANSGASSPTQRGLLVYEKLLCESPPPPPADVPALPADVDGAQTTRQRYEEVHMADPACQGCHQFFDPIGFSFEHFDQAGRYRTQENGLEIDASGLLVVDPAADPVAFDGLSELATLAAETPAVTDCVSGLMIGYVFGGAGGEVCVAESARDALQAGEIGMLEYVAQLAGAPHFTEREAP